MAELSPIPVFIMSGNITADQASLEAAFGPFIKRHFPDCKTPGDVLIAMAEGREPDFTYEKYLEQSALERQKLSRALLGLEHEGSQSPTVKRPVVYRGLPPYIQDVKTGGDRL